MSSFFNPTNPRFRRGVNLLSIYSCTAVGFHMLFLADFGSQEHVFSPIQRYTLPFIDNFFEVSESDFKGSSLQTPTNSKLVLDEKVTTKKI